MTSDCSSKSNPSSKVFLNTEEIQKTMPWALIWMQQKEELADSLLWINKQQRGKKDNLEYLDSSPHFTNNWLASNKLLQYGPLLLQLSNEEFGWEDSF